MVDVYFSALKLLKIRFLKNSLRLLQKFLNCSKTFRVGKWTKITTNVFICYYRNYMYVLCFPNRRTPPTVVFFDKK